MISLDDLDGYRLKIKLLHQFVASETHPLLMGTKVNEVLPSARRTTTLGHRIRTTLWGALSLGGSR